MKAFLGVVLGGLLLATQVYPCHITVDGWITGTDDDPIQGNQFRVVVKKNGRVSSTNPGGFLYHVSLSTDTPLNSATIMASIPFDFRLHGGKPVKVFVDGLQVYAGSSLNYTGLGISAGSTMMMRIHLKYGLIGSVVDPSDYPQTYSFSANFNTDPAVAIVGSADAQLTAFVD